MENKNTIIAIVLMAIVWVGFTFFFKPAVEQPAPVSVKETTQVTPPEPVKTAEVQTVTQTPMVPVDNAKVAEEKLINIDNDFMHIQISSSGARIKQLTLKKYRITADPESAPVVLHPEGPLGQATLRTTGREGLAVPANADFKLLSPDGDFQLQAGQRQDVTFRYDDPANGLQVDKIYTFDGDGYQFDLRYRIMNLAPQNKSGVLQLSMVQPWDEEVHSSRYDFIGPASFVGEDLQTEKVKKLAEESKTYRQPTWSGFQTKYFINAAAPLNSSIDKVTISKEGELIENTFSSPYLNLAPQSSGEIALSFYFGPLDFDILKLAGHKLDQAVDFGFFSPIASPLRYVLKFFYDFVGNYGIAIILLTVIIKLIFWPLTQKSYTSMKEMQKIQPEMARIREKYKNDKERINKEVMTLYKEKRVNPLGGCLPMVIQIPVFFALYRVLMVDIALRHAPFVFWLQDLSTKDPYYITPIIMGGTMFIQQKMTPTTMDPKQAKMFMMMPVVFTFLFLNFPSGLVVYWLTNNLLTIGQQYMIHRKPA